MCKLIFSLLASMVLYGQTVTPGGGGGGGGGGGVTSVATTSPVTGGTITTTGTIGCATCGVTGSPLSQFASTTSAQLLGTLSDATGTGAAVFGTSPTLVTPVLGTPASGTLTNTTGYPWSALAPPSGNLSLAMGSDTSIFTTTTALNQLFAWKNTTAAIVGTSQGSPVISLCGTAFHGSASVEDCMTFSELPGNGNDAAISFNVGHTGTSTGSVSTTFTGAVISSAAIQLASASPIRFGPATSGRDIITSPANHQFAITGTDAASAGLAATGAGDVAACYNGTSFQLTFGACPPIVENNAANTATSTMTLDMSAATGTAALKVPTNTTNTATAAGAIDYDSTNSNYHVNSGADSILGLFPTASVPTTGHVIDASVASSKVLLHDSGLATANLVTASSPGAGIAHFAGSTQALTSSAVVLGDMATQAANTVLGNFTSGSATPTATSVASCSGNNDGEIYTTSTGFGCGTNFGQLNVASTWSALQTFGTNISIGGVTATGATGTGNVAFSAAPTFTGTATFATISPAIIDTVTNCAGAGTAANPSIASCSAAPVGAFSCATNASTGTCKVNTTAVTANSVIQIQPDASLGTALSVTCNTSVDTGLTAPRLASKVAATSFTINMGTYSTNPECFTYVIIN